MEQSTDRTFRFSPVKIGWIAAAVALPLMAALSFYAWAQLPADARIPVHWGINGQPDRYGGKAEALLLAPGIGVAFCLLFSVIPFIEPRRKNLLQSGGVFATIWVAMLVFLGALHAVLVANALGYSVDIGTIVPIGVGGLFVVIGYALRGVRSNFLMGIRTPWTLSSERAWEKTHRAGGIGFMILGFAFFFFPLLPRSGASVVALVVAAVAMSAGLVVYSYIVWRNDPNKQTLGR